MVKELLLYITRKIVSGIKRERLPDDEGKNTRATPVHMMLDKVKESRQESTRLTQFALSISRICLVPRRVYLYIRGGRAGVGDHEGSKYKEALYGYKARRELVRARARPRPARDELVNYFNESWLMRSPSRIPAPHTSASAWLLATHLCTAGPRARRK